MHTYYYIWNIYEKPIWAFPHSKAESDKAALEVLLDLTGLIAVYRYSPQTELDLIWRA